MQEWLNWHAWKACVRETVPWVRIPLSPQMFYTYILKSLNDGTHYYGSSHDHLSRLKEHNSGKVRYTKGHRPWKLYYFEEYQTKAEAIKRERFFKSVAGYKWLKKMKII